MCNVQYVSSAERCRFSIAHCSLLIGGVRFRGSMREKCFRRILSMNHRCFPRRFRATADWRETKSAVALNLWGKSCRSSSSTSQSPATSYHSTPDPVQGFSQRVEEAWPLTLDPSPRAIHVSGATARGEGRVRGHANSIVSGALSNWRFAEIRPERQSVSSCQLAFSL